MLLEAENMRLDVEPLLQPHEGVRAIAGAGARFEAELSVIYVHVVYFLFCLHVVSCLVFLFVYP